MHHHFPLHLAPTGSVHGKPRALGCSANHSTLPHALALTPFQSQSATLMIVSSKNCRCISLPSARSKPVLLRFMVMPCQEGDKVTKQKNSVGSHAHPCPPVIALLLSDISEVSELSGHDNIQVFLNSREHIHFLLPWPLMS